MTKKKEEANSWVEIQLRNTALENDKYADIQYINLRSYSKQNQSCIIEQLCVLKHKKSDAALIETAGQNAPCVQLAAYLFIRLFVL